MDNNIPRIEAFHYGVTSMVDDFITGKRPILCTIEDGIWLGNGMYFWDNKGNLAYWKRIKDKQSTTAFSAVRVVLLLNKMLDLTSETHVEFCKKIQAELKSVGIKEFDERQLGKNINVLFDKSAIFEDLFNLVRVHGLYAKREDDYLSSKITKKTFHKPTANVRTIYCVKSDEPIIYKVKEVI